MRKLCALLLVGATAFSACTEKGPAIDFGKSPVASDTDYLAKVEAADERVVLVEEFTGASCSPCPTARQLLNAVVAQHPDHIIPVEIHLKDFPQSKPKSGAKYDFRTQDGTEISRVFYGLVNSMPTAGVNRLPYNGNILLSPTAWATAINAQLTIQPQANVRVTSAYDESAKTATIKVTVAYLQAVAKDQFLTVAVLENDLIDKQDMPDGTTKDDYKFEHTLRDIITDHQGDRFLADMASKEPGRVYERTFIYQIDGSWNPDHCEVVAFVHNNQSDSKEILQAAKAKLKGQ
jgi:hypothetical protein